MRGRVNAQGCVRAEQQRLCVGGGGLDHHLELGVLCHPVGVLPIPRVIGADRRLRVRGAPWLRTEGAEKGGRVERAGANLCIVRLHEETPVGRPVGLQAGDGVLKGQGGNSSGGGGGGGGRGGGRRRRGTPIGRRRAGHWHRRRMQRRRRRGRRRSAARRGRHRATPQPRGGGGAEAAPQRATPQWCQKRRARRGAAPEPHRRAHRGPPPHRQCSRGGGPQRRAGEGGAAAVAQERRGRGGGERQFCHGRQQEGRARGVGPQQRTPLARAWLRWARWVLVAGRATQRQRCCSWAIAPGFGGIKGRGGGRLDWARRQAAGLPRGWRARSCASGAISMD